MGHRNLKQDVQAKLTSEWLKHSYTTARLRDNVLLQPARYKLFGHKQSEKEFSTKDDDSDTTNDEPLKDFFDAEWSLLSSDLYKFVDESVFVIQPHVESSSQKLTTPKLQLEESIALVESLPSWKVVGKFLGLTKHPHSQYIFPKKSFETLLRKAAVMPSFSSIFLSVEKMSPLQKETYSKAFKVEKIFDRYTLVLQIFRLRVRTKEAKLQVALAEMPYVRAMLAAKSSGNYQRHSIVGESFQDRINQEFRFKEQKLKKLLKSLKQKRDAHRASRKRANVPVVAVVGYTNAGKTSLIKALTASETMEPKDQLFATLDVTAHAAVLPNNLRYVLVDTVGFLSDLPHELFDAFSATMEDMLQADLIIHVRDSNHPDHSNQLRNVLLILSNLRLEERLLSNIIEVRNKIDLLPVRTDEDGEVVNLPEVSWPKSQPLRLKGEQVDMRPAVICRVSATSGAGIRTLINQIQKSIMRVTNRQRVVLCVPAGGSHLQWIRNHGAVESVTGDGDYHLSLTTIVTQAQLHKFLANFDDVKITQDAVF
ncbi:unnamed protein product [Clavelina lepadiformis]|uniref:Hflx-type G domain-containing protein n=1 Tax=Clavelina lepadiformis TaxID=159417 RepID=A0ABP0F0R5_CLALP